VIKQHIWLLDKCKILLRICGQDERAVLIGPSNGRSLSSAVGRSFESRRWIGCALADQLSFGHPTAELCYVGLHLIFMTAGQGEKSLLLLGLTTQKGFSNH
jgi:hypothetical protein